MGTHHHSQSLYHHPHAMARATTATTTTNHHIPYCCDTPTTTDQLQSSESPHSALLYSRHCTPCPFVPRQPLTDRTVRTLRVLFALDICRCHTPVSVLTSGLPWTPHPWWEPTTTQHQTQPPADHLMCAHSADSFTLSPTWSSLAVTPPAHSHPCWCICITPSTHILLRHIDIATCVGPPRDNLDLHLTHPPNRHLRFTVKHSLTHSHLMRTQQHSGY